MHLKRKFFTSRQAFLGAISVFAVFLLAACGGSATPTPIPTTAAMPMEASGGMQMDMSAVPFVPAGMAYAEGQEIRFIHTEVSDADVAKILTDMMSSPVLVVPSLAEASPEMVSKVYVFKNGVKGMGPLGFQPDVFDNPPGTEGYSPLRKIIMVTWNDESEARELKSLGEVLEAEKNAEISLEETDIVVNMPFITWPGGQR